MNALQAHASEVAVQRAGVGAFLGMLAAGFSIQSQLKAVLAAYRAHGRHNGAVCTALMLLTEASPEYCTAAVELHRAASRL